MPFNPVLGMMIIVSAVVSAQPGLAYEEVEDRVDIVATDKTFVALVDGRRSFQESRRSHEVILWQGAKGDVGAFLTSDRLLGIAVTSGRWNARYLKVSEKKAAPNMLLAAHLVVMISAERIMAFGAHTGGVFQERLPIREAVVTSQAEGRVAVVITPKRAFGISAHRRGAAEFQFRIQEQFETVKTTTNKITLQTSQRLVAFTAIDAVWREVDLD